MTVQQWSEDTLVAALADDPELSDDMAEVDERLRGTCCDVVLDLSGLKALTSHGISLLLRLRKKMIERGRRLILCSPQDRVWGVFLATSLDGIFVFATSVTEALAILESRRRT
jgi:anti-anti-sigma factor